MEALEQRVGVVGLRNIGQELIRQVGERPVLDLGGRKFRPDEFRWRAMVKGEDAALQRRALGELFGYIGHCGGVVLVRRAAVVEEGSCGRRHCAAECCQVLSLQGKKEKKKKKSLGQIYSMQRTEAGWKTYCDTGQSIAYTGFICVGFSIGPRIVDRRQGTAMTRIRGHDIPGNAQAVVTKIDEEDGPGLR